MAEHTPPPRDASTPRPHADTTTPRPDGEAATPRPDGEAATPRPDGEAATPRPDGEAATPSADAEAGPAHSASPELLAQLPRSLTDTTAIVTRSGLESGEVRVEFDAAHGLVDAASVRIVAAPDASAASIRRHALTVEIVRQYSGFQGRIRRLLDQLIGLIEGRDVTAGSPAWEARLELRKLDRLARERMQDLRDVDPDGVDASLIREDLADLEAQAERAQSILRGDVVDPQARGFVAMEGRGTLAENSAAARSAGWPDLPSHHHYRRRSDGGFDVVTEPGHTRRAWVVEHDGRRHLVDRDMNATELANYRATLDGAGEPPPGHRWIRDEQGRWQSRRLPNASEDPVQVQHGPNGLPLRNASGELVLAPSERRTFGDRQESAAAAYSEPTHTALERQLDAAGVLPAERGMLRQWGGVLAELDLQVAAHVGEGLKTGAEFAERVTRPPADRPPSTREGRPAGPDPVSVRGSYSEATYERFRRELRAAQIEVIFSVDGAGNARRTPDEQLAILDAFTRMQPDNASGGALLTAYRTRRQQLSHAQGGFEGMTHMAIPNSRLSGLTEMVDGAVRITQEVRAGRRTLVGAGQDLAVDDKSGTSFSRRQCGIYNTHARAHGGRIITQDGASWAGVIYFFRDYATANQAANWMRANNIHANIHVVVLPPLPADARPAATTGGLAWLR
jgi:hypothetical protein